MATPLTGELDSFLKSPAKIAPTAAPAAVSASAPNSDLHGELDSFLKAPEPNKTTPVISPQTSKVSEQPGFWKRTLLPAFMWGKGREQYEKQTTEAWKKAPGDALRGVGELGLGLDSAALDLVGKVGGEGVRSHTEPISTGMKRIGKDLHARSGGSFAEGVGFYGPQAAVAPLRMGAAALGAASNVASNIFDPTKDDKTRYGLVENAKEGAVGAIAGHYGDKLIRAAPVIAKGAIQSIKALPEAIHAKGIIGAVGADVWRGAKAAGGAVAKDIAGKVGGAMEVGLPARVKNLTPAEKVIAKTAESAGYDSKAANQLARDAQKHGINLPLFGLLDNPNLTRYAQAIGSFSGGAKKAAEMTRDIRSQQVPKAINETITGIGKQPGITPLQSGTALTSLMQDVYKAKEKQLIRTAKPFYDALRGEALPPALHRSYMAQPEIRQALGDVMKLYGADTPHYPGLNSLVKQPSTEIPNKMTAAQFQDFLKGTLTKEPDYNNNAIWNEVKKALGGAGRAEKDPYRKARLFDLSSMVSDGLREHSENFRKATAVYEEDALGGEVRQLQGSIYKTLRDLHSDKADKAMAKVFTYSPEVISDVRRTLVGSGNQAAKDVWDNAMAGFMTEVFDNVRKTNPFEFSKQLFGDAKAQQQLKAALPDRYDSLKDFFGIIEKTQETLGKLPTSLTASLSEAQKNLGQDMSGGISDKLGKNWKQIAFDSVKNAYIKNMVQNPEGAEHLARLLFSDEGLTLLNKVKEAPVEFKPAAALTLIQRMGTVTAPAYLNHIWNTNMEAPE